MDADLQHPPELIPVLLAEADRGADLVVASRYAPGGSHEGLGTPVRRLVSRDATARRPAAVQGSARRARIRSPGISSAGAR